MDSGIRQAAVALPDNAITVAPVGTVGAHFNTIAAALAFAVAGDTILIFPGTYAESNLTLVAGVNLVGTDPDQCIISVADAANPILNSAVACTISNITVQNLNAGAPALRVTANTLTARHCRIIGTGGGDSIQMRAGTARFYETYFERDIDLSTAPCALYIYHCMFNLADIYTAGAFAHSMEILESDFQASSINSNATGATTLFLEGCTRITTCINSGTGLFTIRDSDIVDTLYQSNAAGKTRVYGGFISDIGDNAGPIEWYQDGFNLKVIRHMQIAPAIPAAAAPAAIDICAGTFPESNLTLVDSVNLVGRSPDVCTIAASSAVNPIINSAVTCTISNLTVQNTNAGAPAIKVTAGTLTIRNCNIKGTGAGDSIQMTGGTLNVYDSTIGPGDIDLSTGNCTLRMYRCRIVTDPIDTAGALIHNITLENCDLGAVNINSNATGATTLTMKHCSNVGTVSNLGTGIFTITNSLLVGVTVNNASAIIRLRACEYRVITRTLGNIVDESMSLVDGLFKVIHKVWEVLTAAVYNSRTAGAGSITLGGAGQVLLKIGNAAADIAGLESAADAAGALASSLTPARTIRYVQQFSASAFAAANGCRHFFGVRATLGDVFPAAAEQHAGFIWDGTNFYASSSDGTAQTTNLTTPSTAAQHTLEVIVFGGVKAEFYVDGVLLATHFTRYPAAAMYWQELIHGTGSGAASACSTTLRRGRVQECPS